MKYEKKELLYNTLASICGVWFLLTGWIWTYGINLFISYPLFLIGAFLWKKGKEINKQNHLNKFAAVTLILGFIISVSSLFLYK